MVVAEPTMCAPVHGHKGGLGMEVTVHGHAAHSSKPHLGKNAITAAARIILAVDAEQQRLSQLEPTTSVGNGTIVCAEIEGGVARNIIPDSCCLYVGRRSVPGEDPEQLYEQLSALIRDAALPCLRARQHRWGGFGIRREAEVPLCRGCVRVDTSRLLHGIKF